MPDLMTVPINVDTPGPTTANHSLFIKNVTIVMIHKDYVDDDSPQASEIGRTQVPLRPLDRETTSTEPSDVDLH